MDNKRDTQRKKSPRWRIIKLIEPVAGLDELYERDRTRYADATAERVLGPVGRMIAASKTSYWRAHPTNVPVFNANLCTRTRGKIWFGDLDLTNDEALVIELAAQLQEPVYVLFEQSARFGAADAPLFGEYVIKVGPDGTVEVRHWIVRGDDGRLHEKTRNDA